MAVGHSDDVDSVDAVAVVIDQCRAALGGLNPQAGILFAAWDSFDRSIVDAVVDAFPGVQVIGATSAAEISSINGYQEDSITLSLFASDDVDITVGLGGGLADDVDAACQAAVDQALAATKKDPKLCIVLTEGLARDPQLVLEGMGKALPKDVVVVGGASAQRDFSSPAPGYQFRGGEIVQNGIAVLLFSGPIAFSTAVGTGWRTLGAVGTVTKSAAGAVSEIDGRPALEFLARYLDATGPAAFGNPLAVTEAGATEFYLRAIQGSDPATGSVLLTGEVPVGATVQLTTADTDEILAGTKGALAQAMANFPAGATPEAALIFSCAIRQYLLGSRTRVEAELARSEFGTSIPLTGLYCYGEIGPIEGAGTSRFFQETFVTLLLGT
ncbi:MAG TPA: FIST N-terminal domain-containing protein [Candidatus Limnocylindrales bacterium]|nr:FIST N-terminal domain-containing protein [Candidatus Limnocylindrales bacterium]